MFISVKDKAIPSGFTHIYVQVDYFPNHLYELISSSKQKCQQLTFDDNMQYCRRQEDQAATAFIISLSNYVWCKKNKTINHSKFISFITKYISNIFHWIKQQEAGSVLLTTWSTYPV